MREGWDIVKIGRVCCVIAGQSPKGSFYNDQGDGLPFYQGKKLFGEKFIEAPTTWTTHITKEAKAGDILLSVRAPVGPINFSTENICIGRGLAAIRVSESIDHNFLFYVLLSKQNEISGNEGAVFASINKKQIEAIEIPFPPLEEQKRIVAILDEAFAGIDTAIANTEKNLANARELFESYLNSVFAQRGEGWNEAAIEEVCQLKSGTSVNKKLEKPSGEIAYVKVADMNFAGNGEVILSSSRFLHISDIGKNSIFPVGTTIFPKRGGAIATNKKRLTAIPICADLNVMGVIPTEVLSPKFLFFYFMNVDMAKLSSGTSIPQINNYDIAPLKIAFPTSLDAQDEIIQKLEDLYAQTSALKYIYQQKLNSLKELKQSLLQKAFSGELTSKPDKLIDEAVA